MGHRLGLVWRFVVTGRGKALLGALLIFALAIGVLIGSGPLRAALRGGSADADALAQAEADLKVAQAEASQGHAFADAAGPAAVVARLDGHTIALVRTADATDEDVAAASAHMADAGAQVGAHVALTADWTSDDRAPFRDALAEQMTAALTDPPSGATTSQVLSMALAQSLAPGVAAGDGIAGADDTERADTLWTLLTDAKLVTGERTADVDMFVLVAPGGDVADLASAFTQTSNGTVVGFTGGDAGSAGPATTVTNAATFYGAWAVVAAAINAASGSVGAYDASDAADLIAGLSK